MLDLGHTSGLLTASCWREGMGEEIWDFESLKTVFENIVKDTPPGRSQTYFVLDGFDESEDSNGSDTQPLS